MAIKVAKFLLVWLAIPAALGVIGYYFIGPRIGQVPNLPLSIKRPVSIKVESTQPSSTASGQTTSENTGRFAEPEIDVTVEGTRRSSGSTTRRRNTSPRPRTSRPAPAPENPAPEAPPLRDGTSDEGGSGGAGSGGGDGAGEGEDTGQAWAAR